MTSRMRRVGGAVGDGDGNAVRYTSGAVSEGVVEGVEGESFGDGFSPAWDVMTKVRLTVRANCVQLTGGTHWLLDSLVMRMTSRG